jgi:putrescine transport system ATP-binding protein
LSRDRRIASCAAAAGVSMQAIETERRLATAPDRTSLPLLRIEGVSKQFGGSAAVEHLSLEIHQGEFFALLGPSGCGKTTLLRLIAGFETPSAGRILLDGIDLAHVPPYRRPVNMMFQSYALFPHLDVEANIAFGLKQEGLPRQEIAERVADMLALVKLEGFGRRKPNELSGGQRQRVALARSLIKRPRVLLLDEPMAALDKKLRGETQFELMELQRRLGLTFIIVTHDQSEAMTVADRIGVMDRGRLVQVGSPEEIYERPNSRWVAGFIGEVNLFEGRLGSDRTIVEGTPAGRLRTAAAIDADPGAAVCIAVRPERLRMTRLLARPDEGPSEGHNENSVAGTIVDIGYLGDLSIHKVKIADGSVLKAAIVNSGTVGERLSRHEPVRLTFPPEAAIALTR